MKTSELTGAALDWAVAKAADRLGRCTRDNARPGTSIVDIDFSEQGQLMVYVPKKHTIVRSDPYAPWAPSTDWSQGGPIIEREKIDVAWGEEGWYANMYWRGLDVIPGGAAGESLRAIGDGPTPLIAAMRCFCCSKLGDEVDIPEELCQQQNN